MKKIISFLLVTVFVFQLGNTVAFAKDKAKAKEKINVPVTFSDKPTTVLEGRITLNLPPTEEIQEYSDDNFVNVFISDRDNAFMVLIEIVELYRLSTGDLINDTALLHNELEIEKADYTYTKKWTQNGAEVVYCTYNNIYRNYEYLLKSAIIKMPDNTLMVARVCASSEAYNNINNLADLSDKIIKSINPGSKTLGTENKMVSVYGEDIQAETPKGYAFSYSFGADFGVYRFTKLVVMGQEGASMGIYFGQHPSFNEEKDAYKRSDTILGQKALWYYSKPNKNNAPAYSFVQTIVGFKNNDTYGSDTTFAHIFINYSNDDDRRTMQQIARSLAKVQKTTETSQQ